MTTPAVFPTLRGQGWSVLKTPSFSTRIAAHASGREVRAPYYLQALYQFEVTFNALESTGVANEGLSYNSLQALMAFYLACRGQFSTFLYVDPTDNLAGNAPFATGDGSTKTFTLLRPMGTAGFAEPSPYVTNLGSVTAAGAAVAASLIAPNQVFFASAPANGAALAASFGYGFLCRFLSDEVEFENFMSGLWSVKSLKFRTVK